MSDNRSKSKCVYGLVDPRDETIRHVGASVAPDKRYQSLLRRQAISGATNQRLAWLEELNNSDLEPQLIIMNEATPDWRNVERELQIKHSETILSSYDRTHSTMRGIPENARSIEELITEHERWTSEARAVVVNTRRAAGMSQAAFAKQMNTSQSYISEIEHGYKTPSSETLKKLRSVTGGEISGNTDKDPK